MYIIIIIINYYYYYYYAWWLVQCFHLQRSTHAWTIIYEKIYLSNEKQSPHSALPIDVRTSM